MNQTCIYKLIDKFMVLCIQHIFFKFQIAKNPKKGAVDNIILDARRKQEELENAAKLAKEQAFIDLKNTWDRYV